MGRHRPRWSRSSPSAPTPSAPGGANGVAVGAAGRRCGIQSAIGRAPVGAAVLDPTAIGWRGVRVQCQWPAARCEEPLVLLKQYQFFILKQISTFIFYIWHIGSNFLQNAIWILQDA
jgi:hypothetical protein